MPFKIVSRRIEANKGHVFDKMIEECLGEIEMELRGYTGGAPRLVSMSSKTDGYTNNHDNFYLQGLTVTTVWQVDPQ